MLNNTAQYLSMPTRNIELNLMQAAAVLSNKKLKIPNINIEAARGTGKSTVELNLR